jgi:hypothetical protein
MIKKATGCRVVRIHIGFEHRKNIVILGAGRWLLIAQASVKLN